MKKFKDILFLKFAQLVFVWTVFALLFQITMMVIVFFKPDLAREISNEISWKIDGTFKNDPNNIWYDGNKTN